MKIGQLAAAANCSTETIRYYEKAGLLPPPARNASNYREYGPAHLERLRLIRNCRSLDMTHDEIRGLLQTLDAATQGCQPVNQLLDEHIGHVDTRIAELQSLRSQLLELRQRCAQESAVKDCGIIEGLSEMDIPARSHSHLG